MTTFLLLIACGIVGGLLFFFLHIPGGAMLGAVVAVLAVKMLGHVETDTPHLFQLGAQIAIGVMVGNMMTGGTLLEIRAMAPLMFGSTALLAVKMLGHVETDTPHLFQLGAQIAIGVMVGNMMTGGTLLEIRAMAPLMFGSTALLVVAGALGAWFICRSAGLDAGSAILATSPGGLQAVVGMASDLGTNAPAVLAFHLVRLYTVLLLAPFLGWLLHRLLPHS